MSNIERIKKDKQDAHDLNAPNLCYYVIYKDWQESGDCSG